MAIITAYSIFISLVTVSLFMVLFSWLSERIWFLQKSTLLFFNIFSVIILVRILFPFDFPLYTKTVTDYRLLPLIVTFLIHPHQVLFFPPVRILDFLLLWWIAGALHQFYKYVKSYIVLCNRLKFIPTTKDNQILQILNQIREEHNYKFYPRIIVHPTVQSPMEYGFIRQTILLPCKDYSNEALFFILSHELRHFANKTNWIKALLLSLQALLWWNPATKHFTNAMISVLEYDCDQFVTGTSDQDRKLSYLKCLISSKRDTFSGDCSFETPFAHFDSVKSLKRRFTLISYPAVKNRIMTLLSIFILTVGFILSYGVVFQPGFMPPDEDMHFPKFNSTNAYIVENADGTYDLYYENKSFINMHEIADDFKQIPILEERNDSDKN